MKIRRVTRQSADLMGAASGEVYVYSCGDSLVTILRPFPVNALFSCNFGFDIAYWRV